LDPETGAEFWRTKIKGSNFVNVAVHKDRVLATTGGEVFCLDRSSGRLLWHNPLRGLGLGLVTVATDSSSGQASVLAAQLQQDEAAASAAAASTTVAAS
jgi:outer membrane protein assembly factor BamB